MSDLGIPLSGLNAASTRLFGAARNIAGAFSVATGPEEAFQPTRTVQESAAAGGTVARLVPVDPPSLAISAPFHPLADEAGRLHIPNVSLEAQFVELLLAKHAYKANATALQTMAEIQDRLVKLDL